MLSSKDFVDTTTDYKTTKVASSRFSNHKAQTKILASKVMTTQALKDHK